MCTKCSGWRQRSPSFEPNRTGWRQRARRLMADGNNVRCRWASPMESSRRTYVCAHVCSHVHIYAHVCTHVVMCTLVHRCAHVCPYVHTCAQMTRTSTRTQTSIHTHTHTHTHAQPHPHPHPPTIMLMKFTTTTKRQLLLCNTMEPLVITPAALRAHHSRCSSSERRYVRVFSDNIR